nr:hypothetical protein [Tanacetum cinerariifolium]
MEECHKLLTNSVDDPILRNNVSKPLPLGGPPAQVTIQSDLFFNNDLEYLRYGSKGSRPALSISKMKAAYYPNESPKTPPGSPSHQPPPPPLPAGPSGPSGAPGASGSSQVPPPPPALPPSTSQESPSKGSAAPSPSKTVASAEYQAWTTTDDMGPDKQAQLSAIEDIESAHIPKVNLRQDWWKPLKEERIATPEPAWSLSSFDAPIPPNN